MNKFKMAASVKSFSKRTSKSGKDYGMLLVQNHEGNFFELPCFGYNNFTAASLTPGEVVTLTGKLSSNAYKDKNGNDRYGMNLSLADENGIVKVGVQATSPAPTAKAAVADDIDSLPF